MAKKPASAKSASKAAAAERAPDRHAPRPVVRPTSLDAVIGQKRAVDALRGAMGSGRVHHAWIFSGPVGVGKFTAACAFAAELLTDRGPGKDETQDRLRTGTHPDLHVVTKELAEVSREPSVRKSKQTSIAKEVAEEYLIEPAQRSRVIESDSHAGKVFIVDEAELLNHSSQNAILKLLEEPPLGTVLILVTTDEHRLLATIRSRAQRVPFGALDTTALQAWLAGSGLDLQGPERDWLLAYGNGSPGQILTAQQMGLFNWHVKLDKMLTALAAGGQQAEAGTAGLGQAMTVLVEERAKAVQEENEKASKETANRLWCRRMLTFVAERLRRQMIGAARGGTAPGQAERAAALAAALDAVAAADRYLDSNVPYGAVLDNLVAQIASGRSELALMPSL